MLQTTTTTTKASFRSYRITIIRRSVQIKTSCMLTYDGPESLGTSCKDLIYLSIRLVYFLQKTGKHNLTHCATKFAQCHKCVQWRLKSANASTFSLDYLQSAWLRFRSLLNYTVPDTRSSEPHIILQDLLCPGLFICLLTSLWGRSL